MLDGVSGKKNRDEDGYHIWRRNIKEKEALEKKKKNFDSVKDKKSSPTQAKAKKRSCGWCLWILLLFFLLGGTALAVGYYKYQRLKSKVIQKNESAPPQALLGANVSGISTNENDRDQSEERINILLLGVGGEGHSGGNLTDVIQLFSYNIRSQKALIVSIPRDLYLNIENYGYGKINEMYLAGMRQGEGRGGALAKKEVGKVLALEVHYFIKIDFAGFVKIIDELGGIDVEVEQAIADPSQDTYISQGPHHFNGMEALKYVRSRKTSSDFARSERQQKTLIAIKDKTMSLNILINPFKINRLLQILADHLATDISISEAKKIAGLFRGLRKKNIESYVINNNPQDNLLYSTYNNRGQYILLPRGGNFKKIQKFIEKKLP